MSKQRQLTPVFTKGINRRFPITRTDEPDRLYTLKNARLMQRGESGFVSRIAGSTLIPTTTAIYKKSLASIVHTHIGEE